MSWTFDLNQYTYLHFVWDVWFCILLHPVHYMRNTITFTTYSLRIGAVKNKIAQTLLGLYDNWKKMTMKQRKLWTTDWFMCIAQLEVNTCTPVIWGHCGNVILEQRNIARSAALRDIPRSKAKCKDFPQCPKLTDAKLLTSFITITFLLIRLTYYSLYTWKKFFHQNFHYNDYLHEKSERLHSKSTSKSCHARTSSDTGANCLHAQYTRAWSKRGVKYSSTSLILFTRRSTVV